MDGVATQSALAGGLLQPAGEAGPEQTTATPAIPAPTPDLIAEALAGLAQGRMLFNPPDEMRTGERERVELRIQPAPEGIAVSDPAGGEASSFQAGLVGEGQPRISDIEVGTFMKARLTSDGFDVIPLNEEEQIVSGEDFTQWAWDIVALSSGEQVLNLTITVRVDAGGSQIGVRDLPVVTETVRVRVDPTYTMGIFVGKYWQWLVTVLLLPFLGWGWRSLSTRQNRMEPKSPAFFE